MLSGRELLFAPTHIQQVSSGSDSSRNVSSSTPLIAFGFVALDTQLASIDIRVGSGSGSPVANVYLVPGTSSTTQDSPVTTPTASALASATNVSLAVGINTISFGSHTLTVGEKYWLVFKYVSGTSAGFYYLGGALFNQSISGPGRVTRDNYLRIEATSATEPVTWISPAAVCVLTALRQVYTSGKTHGFLGINGGDTTNTVRHRSEASGEVRGIGQAFTIPVGMRLNLKAFVIGFRVTTSTATDIEFYAECYINRSLVATSLPQYSADLYSTGHVLLSFEFERPIKVPDNCELLIMVMCKYHTDAYYFYSTRLSLLDNYANEHMPQPIRRAAYYVNDGTGITVNQNAVTSCGLLLDADEPFYTAPINRRTSTGR